MLSDSQQIERRFHFNSHLNSESIERFFGQDMEFCLKMFEVFLHTVPGDLRQLEDAINEKDFIAIKALSHKLKTNFQFVGLDRIKEYLVKIERGAKEQSVFTFMQYEELSLVLDESMALIRSEILRITKFLN